MPHLETVHNHNIRLESLVDESDGQNRSSNLTPQIFYSLVAKSVFRHYEKNENVVLN